jgi:chloramphenicol O-acetyltransferase type B
MSEIRWGNHSYGDMKITGGSFGQVIIGKYCSLGEDITAFMAHDHNISNISTFPFGHKGMKITKLMSKPLPRIRYNKDRKLKVVIGNDVWIGSHTVIFREVNIGDGAVIGAYSKITKDVKPYSIVVGDNKIIGQRFSDEVIKFLLKLKWWNQPDSTVAQIGDILCSDDISLLKSWSKLL